MAVLSVTSFSPLVQISNTNKSKAQYFSNFNLVISSPFFNNNKTNLYHRLAPSASVLHVSDKDSDQNVLCEDEVDNIGVRAALSIIKFYKSEISPLLPKSCRYVPTCSEYSMIAYKKYGFVKGSALTAWRICRCNPLGGTGFDPPRWFGESISQDQ